MDDGRKKSHLTTRYYASTTDNTYFHNNIERVLLHVRLLFAPICIQHNQQSPCRCFLLLEKAGERDEFRIMWSKTTTRYSTYYYYRCTRQRYIFANKHSENLSGHTACILPKKRNEHELLQLLQGEILAIQ